MADLNNSLLRITDGFKKIFGSNSVVPGSKLYQMAESIAYEAYVNADTIDTFVYNNSLATATGDTLTQIGLNFFGIERIKATVPTVTKTSKAIKFYTNNGITFGTINQVDGVGSNITVNEGTLIQGTYNNTTYIFRVTETTVLNYNSNEAYVSAEMLSGDTALIPSNTLTSHNCSTYTLAKSNLLLVTNPVSIGMATPEETDNNFRYRLMNSIKSKDSSSYHGIKNKILELPGVSNVEIINSAYGGGTFSAIVQGITPVTSDDLLSYVKSEIQNIVPPWVYFTVEKPNYIGLTITIGLNTLGTNDIPLYVITSIKNAVSNFINNFFGSYIEVSQIRDVAQQAAYSYYATVNSIKMYTGSGEFRMYEELDITSNSTRLYINSIDKLVIEPGIYNPVDIEVNI